MILFCVEKSKGLICVTPYRYFWLIVLFSLFFFVLGRLSVYV